MTAIWDIIGREILDGKGNRPLRLMLFSMTAAGRAARRAHQRRI